jgi:hypothetical protein
MPSRRWGTWTPPERPRPEGAGALSLDPETPLRIPAPTLLLLLPACTPDRDEWWDAYAKARCDTWFDCDERASEHYWEDEGECREEFLSLVDRTRFEPCTYDRSAAHGCLVAWRDIECEPPYEQYQDVAYWCDQVWYCP